MSTTLEDCKTDSQDNISIAQNYRRMKPNVKPSEDRPNYSEIPSKVDSDFIKQFAYSI